MKEDEERRRKQDEQAEKQRQREREIEEKLARKQNQDISQEHSAEVTAPSSSVYRPRAAGGSGFVAKAANPEKNVDNESPWRRNDETKETSGDNNKYNYTRGGGANRERGGGGDGKQDVWRRPDNDRDQRRTGDDENRGGMRGVGSFGNRADRGGPSSGGMERNNERGGGFGGARGGRGGGGGSRFGGENKADSSDSWRRRGDDSNDQ